MLRSDEGLLVGTKESEEGGKQLGATDGSDDGTAAGVTLGTTDEGCMDGIGIKDG